MGIPAWAVPGARVVCVDDAVRAEYVWFDGEAVISGAVYTITRALIDSDGDAILHLAEVERHEDSRRLWGKDVGYGIWRFRPVHTLESDMEAHFTALLSTPVPQLEDAAQ